MLKHKSVHFPDAEVPGAMEKQQWSWKKEWPDMGFNRCCPQVIPLRWTQLLMNTAMLWGTFPWRRTQLSQQSQNNTHITVFTMSFPEIKIQMISFYNIVTFL